MDVLSSAREKRIGNQKRKFQTGFGFIWIIIFIFFSFIQKVWGDEILRYSIVSRGMVLGEMIYEIETMNEEMIYRSFFITNQDEEPQRDMELIVNRENLTPVLSRKWFEISEGEIILETRYSKDKAEVILISPYGKKEASLKVTEPIYDMEQIFFLPNLENTGNFQNRQFSVLVPASGMTWLGRINKVDEDEKSIKLKYTLAGEILYLQYEKSFPYHLLSLEAPNRGYDLILKEEIPNK